MAQFIPSPLLVAHPLWTHSPLALMAKTDPLEEFMVKLEAVLIALKGQTKQLHPVETSYIALLQDAYDEYLT